MVGRSFPRPGRIIRPRPTFPVVVKVAEHIKVLLPTGRTGVKLPAACQVQARNDKMKFMMSGVIVPHPKNVALIRLKSGKSQGFKVVHNPLFLLRRYGVGRMPGKHPSGELPFSFNGINEVAGNIRITAQHLRRRFFPAGIVESHKVAGGHIAIPLAVRKDFHVHASTSVGGAFTSRSKLTRAISTSRASARLLCILTQRASWFRFAPMRASCRMRSFSRGVCRRR